MPRRSIQPRVSPATAVLAGLVTIEPMARSRALGRPCPERSTSMIVADLLRKPSAASQRMSPASFTRSVASRLIVLLHSNACSFRKAISCAEGMPSRLPALGSACEPESKEVLDIG
jgi:hypothetical protein